jgi:hypothetical protein
MSPRITRNDFNAQLAPPAPASEPGRASAGQSGRPADGGSGPTAAHPGTVRIELGDPHPARLVEWFTQGRIKTAAPENQSAREVAAAYGLPLSADGRSVALPNDRRGGAIYLDMKTASLRPGGTLEWLSSIPAPRGSSPEFKAGFEQRKGDRFKEGMAQFKEQSGQLLAQAALDLASRGLAGKLLSRGSKLVPVALATGRRPAGTNATASPAGPLQTRAQAREQALMHLQLRTQAYKAAPNARNGTALTAAQAQANAWFSKEAPDKAQISAAQKQRFRTLVNEVESVIGGVKQAPAPRAAARAPQPVGQTVPYKPVPPVAPLADVVKGMATRQAARPAAQTQTPRAHAHAVTKKTGTAAPTRTAPRKPADKTPGSAGAPGKLTAQHKQRLHEAVAMRGNPVRPGESAVEAIRRGVDRRTAVAGAGAMQVSPEPLNEPPPNAASESSSPSAGANSAIDPLNSSGAAGVQRDALTSQYFNGNVSSDTIPDDQLSVPTFKIGNHVLSVKDLAALTGAPDGTRIEARYVDGDARPYPFDNRPLQIDGLNDLYSADQQTFIYPASHGRLVLFRSDLALKYGAPKGLGTRMLATQVRAAERLGVARIANISAGPWLNGYYTWPRLGFTTSKLKNAQIDALKSASILPKDFAGPLSLGDLLYPSANKGQTWSGDAALQWWKANGDTLSTWFDVTPGSKSRQVLEDYLRQNNVQL